MALVTILTISRSPLIYFWYIQDIPEMKLTYHSVTKRIEISDQDLFNHLRIRHTECNNHETHDKELRPGSSQIVLTRVDFMYDYL